MEYYFVYMIVYWGKYFISLVWYAFCDMDLVAECDFFTTNLERISPMVFIDRWPGKYSWLKEHKDNGLG